MAKNRDKTDKRLKNLKTDAGPGRPPGQKNYATLYRNALIKLGQLNGKDPDEIELEMIANGLASARKGDYRFYKDVLDRLHGTPVARHEVTGKDGEALNTFDEKQIKTIASLVCGNGADGDSEK